MQIKLDTFDFAPELRGHRPVSNFTIDGVRVVQTATGLRAGTVSHWDRGNRETVITFDVTREHDSIEDAMAYVCTHQETAPTKGLLTMTVKYGMKTIRRYMDGATLFRNTSRALGIATFHSYEIRGGAIVVEEPLTT